MPAGYTRDLAAIHDQGFSALAEAAASMLIDALHRCGVRDGLVVELGCGGGVFAAKLCAAGFDVLGYDLSPSMIALARRRVPSGRFEAQSLWTAPLPSCVAAAAIGECVNYRFDERSSLASLERLFRRVYRALRPGGLWLFDVAGQGRLGKTGLGQGHRIGDDWAVVWTAREDRSAGTLTREITTFRRAGTHFRRDHDVHSQRLYANDDVATRLRSTGFRVRTLRAYGGHRLPAGLTGFLARKEASGARSRPPAHRGSDRTPR
jgi:SAM-dependent methyltransferase